MKERKKKRENGRRRYKKIKLENGKKVSSRRMAINKIPRFLDKVLVGEWP